MLKFNSKDTGTKASVFIFNFEYILHLFYSISLIDFEQVNVC